MTFADIEDPSSVQLVDPNDLAATFGEGYALKKITINATRKPVTDGVFEEVLDCIKQQTACVPINFKLPFGHPLRHMTNQQFKGTQL